MLFRPELSCFSAGKNLKTFILLALSAAALGLWVSGGFLFAGGRQAAGSADMAVSAAEVPETLAGQEEVPALPGEPAAPDGGDAGGVSLDSAPQEPDRFRMAAVPGSLRAGEPVTIGLAVPADAGGGESLPVYAVLVNGQGRRLGRAAFFALPGDPDGPAETAGKVLAAVLAVPSTLRPGEAFIRTEPPIEGLEDLPLTVMERDFVSETIELNEKNTDLRTGEDTKKTVEAEQLWAVLRRPGNTVYALEAFEAPVASTRRTSFFGDRRVYRYVDGSTDTAIHAGIDYGVPRGTEVRACASGKVVLARPRIVTGNSVVVEHLPGLYSLYYHLDTLAVAEGGLVEKGGLLGESGATGLATGPHLHWEIRVAGENADPDAFVERYILDKAAILSKLFEYKE